MTTEPQEKQMGDNFSERTPQEWLQLLVDYQRQLQARLRVGCQPSEYYLLADLDAAVDLVIRRFNRSGFNNPLFNETRINNTDDGGSRYGVQF
ncbi:hypothetical protein EUZ85_17310 [Hahella sp. KA22]|nr:hypothetical protein ENC22_14735 [Hahella sp. KA22]QAY55759.1 hypothetical protein EUZ85_17310 [Hahella sp. KA22]